MKRLAFAIAALILFSASASDAQTLPVDPNKPATQPVTTEPTTPDPKPTTPTKPAEPKSEPVAKPAPDLSEQLGKLKEENTDLRDELELLKEDLKFTDKRVSGLLAVKGRIKGYLDFGFFRVGGDGSGLRSDTGNLIYPQYAGTVPGSWVFLGDPLSTAINSRGDPAETAESRAVTFDSVDNKGVASFIVNALNLQLFAGLGKSVSLTSFVDFVPRSRDVSNSDGEFLGDFVDVKLAYTQWNTSLELFDLRIFAGKFDSVVGREYRFQEAPDRITVTPSLICRYLCGRPLGVKARARFLDSKLIVNVSATNGSNFTESFNFADEVDSNALPTVSGRLSYQLPFAELEVGVSGAYGAQDQQTDDKVMQWHVGADLHLLWKDVEFTAEYVQGDAEGATEAGGAECGLAPCLAYEGAYGLLSYRATNSIVPYFRLDWRNALHLAGASFVYISKLWRATTGLRYELGKSLIFKAEYTVNRELGNIPQFANDVFTSAMIVKY